MKDDYTTNSHWLISYILSHIFLLKGLGECTFWTWERLTPHCTLSVELFICAKEKFIILFCGHSHSELQTNYFLPKIPPTSRRKSPGRGISLLGTAYATGNVRKYISMQQASFWEQCLIILEGLSMGACGCNCSHNGKHHSGSSQVKHFRTN